MTAKIHINLSQGILEVEGEPEFVRSIYDDFKVDLAALRLENSTRESHANANAPALVTYREAESIVAPQTNDEPAQKTSQSAKKLKGAKKESYSYLKELNTGMPEEPTSLAAYLKMYSPNSGPARNTVILKYLKDQHADTAASMDHMYTCYSNAGLAMPGSLYESIKTAANASKGYGYIDRADQNDLKISYKGEVLLAELKKAASATA